jgi:hypothetical protein
MAAATPRAARYDRAFRALASSYHLAAFTPITRSHSVSNDSEIPPTAML